MVKRKLAWNDPVLVLSWAAVVGGCASAAFAAREMGFVVGFLIVVAISATRLLLFRPGPSHPVGSALNSPRHE